jgi:hypothetical protein
VSQEKWRVGKKIEDFCRPCRSIRAHTITLLDANGRPERVICDTCGSQHNYRGVDAGRSPRSSQPGPTERHASAGPAAGEIRRATGGAVDDLAVEGGAPTIGRGDVGPDEMERSRAMPDRPQVTTSVSDDLEALLRRVLREEAGWTPTTLAEKWRGGELVLRPGRVGLQEKTLPIDVLFRKIVAIRNKLRVLEQQVNAADVPDDLKLRLQGYITGCYGSLTSFNVLFAQEEDRFQGTGKDD